jgi:hypothetical protein
MFDEYFRISRKTKTVILSFIQYVREERGARSKEQGARIGG